MAAALQVIPITGIAEVTEGLELATAIADAASAQGTPLGDGDCIVVTQKVVSKAEGRIRRLFLCGGAHGAPRAPHGRRFDRQNGVREIVVIENWWS